MKNKLLLTSISLLLAASMAACSGSVRLELPDIGEAEPENEVHEAEPLKEAARPSTDISSSMDTGNLATLQEAYINIYEKVLPSVVSISVTKTVSGQGFKMPELPFDFNFPQQDKPYEYQQRAAGSGFVWDTEGHIVTNNHVIDGSDSIRVNFSDGKSATAELVGADADSDLAVLKVDLPKSELVPITVIDSTKVRVGQIAVAIGNPFRLESSMTTGIISGIGRSLPVGSNDERGLYYTIPDVIQTDAAINPGNSGGVLVDINGGLIGVTTAIESPVRANSGVGYVIPSIIVKKIVPILIKDGKFEQPWIGISGRDMIPEFADLMGLSPDQQGALVVDVTPGSPAEKAGLRGSSIEGTVDNTDVRVGGDVIIAADDTPINDFEDLVAFLARYTIVGQRITLTVIRDGKEENVELTLAPRPGSKSSKESEELKETSTGGWLGISGIDVTEEIATAMDLKKNTEGLLIETVVAESPADKAGLRGSYKPIELDGQTILIGGDIITKVSGTKISGANQLADILRESEPGATISLSILRDGKAKAVKVTLGEFPE
ncbi:MAG: PDZ domain-containing protein [Anaerolineaceae bacterium]|nr:PDZ domain-containing protein [Anaerolineaceae bacterium]